MKIKTTAPSTSKRSTVARSLPTTTTKTTNRTKGTQQQQQQQRPNSAKDLDVSETSATSYMNPFDDEIDNILVKPVMVKSRTTNPFDDDSDPINIVEIQQNNNNNNNKHILTASSVTDIFRKKNVTKDVVTKNSIANERIPANPPSACHLKGTNPFDDDEDKKYLSSPIGTTRTLTTTTQYELSAPSTPIQSRSDRDESYHLHHHTPADSIATIKTSNRKKDLNAEQWHSLLCSTEQWRQEAVTEKIHQLEEQLQSLIQMLTISNQETVTTGRWVSGLAIAGEQLQQALELGTITQEITTGHENDHKKTKEENGDGKESLWTHTNTNVDDLNELPEKPKMEKLIGEEKEDEEEQGESDDIDTNAAAFPLYDKDNEEEKKQEDNGGASMGRYYGSKSIAKNTKDPPLDAVVIPSHSAQASQPMVVLFQQHNMLHQTLLTVMDTGRTVGKIMELKKVTWESLELLRQQAMTLLREMQASEEEVKSTWALYAKTASAMFDSKIEGDSNERDVTTCNNKVSVANVWLAEVSYRTTVARQVKTMSTHGSQLETYISQVKTSERQRRFRLRYILSEFVMQKHALAFEKVQQTHTESLESYFSQTGECVKNVEHHLPESFDAVSNNINAMELFTKISPRAQIDKLSKICGTTSVWDNVISSVTCDKQRFEECVTTKKMLLEDDNIEIDLDLQPIDLGMETDVGSDCMKHTEKKGSAKNIHEIESIKIDTAKAKKRAGKHEIHTGVVLDAVSSKNSKFLDRILYSGSLLESHYITMAVVAGIEDEPLQGNDSSNNQNKSGKGNVLVVMTLDSTLHIFDLPSIATLKGESDSISQSHHNEAIFPGSKPEDALMFLIEHRAKQDREQKQLMEVSANKVVEENALPIRSKFRMSRATEIEEVKTGFNFTTLCPEVTLKVEDLTIRTMSQGENAVKITTKAFLNGRYSKLNFASLTDQNAFVMSTQPVRELTDI